MSLYRWAAGLPMSTMAWPADSACASSSRRLSCAAGAVGALPRTADDASKLAVALIRGVARIPSGPGRARECSVRRAEIVSGIELVLGSLEASEQAFRSQSREAGGEALRPALLEHSKRLRWAASMTNALQTASRTLETLDSFDTPEGEYLQIAEQLSLIKETLRDFSDVVGNLDDAATGPPPSKNAADAPCDEPAEKLEVFSETCSTASGERSGCCSEACSEDGCDTPRHSRCRDLEAAAEAWPEACADLAAPSPGEGASEECKAQAETTDSPLAESWYNGLYWG